MNDDASLWQRYKLDVDRPTLSAEEMNAAAAAVEADVRGDIDRDTKPASDGRHADLVALMRDGEKPVRRVPAAHWLSAAASAFVLSFVAAWQFTDAAPGDGLQQFGDRQGRPAPSWASPITPMTTEETKR